MTTQSAITVAADILDGHAAELLALLEQGGRDPASNELVPFGALSMVHFARFFILPAARDLDGRLLPSRLMFLADVDGSADAFLDTLVTTAAPGLDRLFQHCRAYPGRARLRAYLRASSIPSAAQYVNTIGRTAEQIRQEAQLRAAIQDFLDRSRAQWPTASSREVRAAVQDFVATTPELAWARQPAPAPDPAFVFGERVQFALTIGAGLVLLPVVLVGLPAWLYFLRRHEKSDAATDVIPTDALVAALAAQEDHGVQNPFTSAGLVKPGPFRRFTGNLILWGTNFLARHIFNHATLIGIKTIHSARWVYLDQKRRVMFASNYDGSLESYMDDFVDKIAWALNASFSSGVDYPKTSWLILEGANDEQVFKRFNLNHQLVAPFWYAAYQGLTALEIDNNAAIRAGLYGTLNDAATRAWLRRL